jgi:aminopeptidase YwaD
MDYDRLAEDALRITSEVIGAHGPRVSGSEGNRKARAALAAMLGKSCDTVREEPFTIRPASLFSIGKIFAAAYLAGAASLLSGKALVLGFGFLAMVFGTVFFAAQFILFLDTFDCLFKGADAANIIGTIEPKSPATRQVVVVGHHDSAPIYPFHERAPLLFPIRLFVPVALYLFCLAALAFGLGSALSGGAATPVWEKWTAALGLAFVLPLYGYMSKRGSPGAGDDLIACAIGLELAGLFRGPGQDLERTRVVVVLTDGEEVGQKGAAFFAKNDEALLRSMDTTVIVLDSIYDYEHLAILGRDRNGISPLSASLASDIKRTAAGLGHELPLASIPFMGGGTDGGQFARRGIRTASIIGQPIKAFSREILFHTAKDLPDRISAEAVSAVIEIVGEYIRARDGAQGERLGS